jgi:disulfide oxidoreductase YuzD
MKLDGSIPEVPTKKWPNNKQIRTASEIHNWLSVYTKRNFLNELFLKKFLLIKPDRADSCRKDIIKRLSAGWENLRIIMI